MQYQKANIDGISRSPLPLSPAVERRPDDSSGSNKTAKKEQKTVGPSKVRTSTLQTGPIVVIVLAVVIMIFLIALAYLAYSKSK